MTFAVRIAPWLFLLILGMMVVITGINVFIYLATGEGFGWFALVVPVWGLLAVALMRNFAVLKVEPHRVVSRMRYRVVKIPLHPTDRLVVSSERLYIGHFNGAWTEVPLNRYILRWSDWAAFEAAVARRWPVAPHQ